jgi:hypothetical protein
MTEWENNFKAIIRMETQPEKKLERTVGYMEEIVQWEETEWQLSN